MFMSYFVKIKSSYANFITMDNTVKTLSRIVWLLLSSANSVSNVVTFSHPLGFPSYCLWGGDCKKRKKDYLDS